MTAPLRRQQSIGAAGAAAAVAVLALWWYLAPAVLGDLPAPHGAVDRLAVAVTYLPAAGATLLVGVWAAARRGFFADAIGGTRTPADHGLEINLRYNQNSVEQVVLAAIAWTGLSLAVPAGRLYLVPAMAATFVVGRAAFWVGYLIHPMGRTFGMTLTILPTLAAYVWLGWHAVGG